MYLNNQVGLVFSPKTDGYSKLNL